MEEIIQAIGIKPYYSDGAVVIYHADCRELLPQLKGVSAVVTDPPYELGFMGKSWDSKGISFQLDTWRLIRESCLSGAMLLSFGGTRTSHRIACAIEDAGWQIRDTIMYAYDNSYQMRSFLETLTEEQLKLLDKAFPSEGFLAWNYGSGFPKSLNISRQLDKKARAKREKRDYIAPDGRKRWGGNSFSVGAEPNSRGVNTISLPSSPEAKLWEGYGTALKPSYEPIILAMNPIDGTFANNALKHGVAGLNIDECRIPSEPIPINKLEEWSGFGQKIKPEYKQEINNRGRFPSNFIHDGSQEVMELFPDSKKGNASGYDWGKGAPSIFMGNKSIKSGVHFGDSGSAARFFYCAKASRRERDAGLEGMEAKGIRSNAPRENEEAKTKSTLNNHPTVKPLALMTYLCKLVKMPEYNLILDPFCGSGTTLLACTKLDIPCIGIDSDEKSCEIVAKRCSQTVMRLKW